MAGVFSGGPMTTKSNVNTCARSRRYSPAPCVTTVVSWSRASIPMVVSVSDCQSAEGPDTRRHADDREHAQKKHHDRHQKGQRYRIRTVAVNEALIHHRVPIHPQHAHVPKVVEDAEHQHADAEGYECHTEMP